MPNYSGHLSINVSENPYITVVKDKSRAIICRQHALDGRFMKGQQVTLDFTTYLRKNLPAIASEDAAPWTSLLVWDENN